MLDDSGRVVGMVAVGRDLSERQQLRAQLIQSAKMASLGVMAGGIAHELRNPLGIISAAAQLMLETGDDRKLRDACAAKIDTATHRASSIIENLLKFARPKGTQEIQRVDPNVILAEALSLLNNQLSLQKVTVVRAFHEDIPAIAGNAELLMQVFTNLIINANNAMPGGGTLTVATRSRGDQVEIRFSDTGRGIPPKNLSRVFDPFFTTMPVGKGVGLGLSISYSIIQQHGGAIEVRSQVGQGTTFLIRLPTNNASDRGRGASGQ